MKLFQLLDRAKISIKGRGIRFAAHTRKFRILVSGYRVSNSARWRRSRRHIAESIDQVCEFIGHNVLLQIRNVVPRVIDSPLFEVASENLVMASLPKCE